MLTPFHHAGCFGTRQPGVGCGAMAQLVARLHGMQKVRGSNPLSSTGFSSLCSIFSDIPSDSGLHVTGVPRRTQIRVSLRS
jgi:hypothetical protein